MSVPYYFIAKTEPNSEHPNSPDCLACKMQKACQYSICFMSDRQKPITLLEDVEVVAYATMSLLSV